MRLSSRCTGRTWTSKFTLLLLLLPYSPTASYFSTGGYKGATGTGANVQDNAHRRTRPGTSTRTSTSTSRKHGTSGQKRVRKMCRCATLHMCSRIECIGCRGGSFQDLRNQPLSGRSSPSPSRRGRTRALPLMARGHPRRIFKTAPDPPTGLQMVRIGLSQHRVNHRRLPNILALLPH